MAHLTASTGEKVYSIRKWLGLNQNPDGDTKLRYGEAAVMDNWRITRDGNLRRRPGTALVESIGSGTVRGLWSGVVAGRECVLAACDGRLYELFDGTDWKKTELGAVSAVGDVFLFGFSRRAYVLDGENYLVYDGVSLQPVEGYRPLVVTASPPEGGGTALEPVNKLTGTRRVRFSPDGTALSFRLPETKLTSVDYVKDLASGETVEGYTVDLKGGVVTFASAPASGADTLEIGYSVSETDRLRVERMASRVFETMACVSLSRELVASSKTMILG